MADKKTTIKIHTATPVGSIPVPTAPIADGVLNDETDPLGILRKAEKLGKKGLVEKDGVTWYPDENRFEFDPRNRIDPDDLRVQQEIAVDTGVDNLPTAEDLLANTQDTDGRSIWDYLDMAGTWIKDNPWSITAPLAIASGIFKRKAIKEDALAKANQLREQGRLALDKAYREREDVEIEHRFEEEDNIEKYKQTGLFSGQESFAKGTGVSGLLTANKNAAQELMADILEQGRQQKAAFDRAATDVERAGREKAKFASLETATKVAGTIL